MQVQINDTVITIPSSLAEFTLGQRIDFQEQHGNALDEIALSIMDMPEGIDKDMETMEFMLEKAFATFGFFAGIDSSVLKESEFVDQILTIYYANLQTLFEEEAAIDLKTTYIWKGEVWELHPPELKNGSRMKFGEFIDSKQLIKDLSELGKNKWEQMLPLAAIYLRKEGEDYQESFMYEDSERLKLMRDLPMDIALSVGFFLSGSLNFCLNRLMFSGPGVASQESLQPGTFIVTDG